MDDSSFRAGFSTRKTSPYIRVLGELGGILGFAFETLGLGLGLWVEGFRVWGFGLRFGVCRFGASVFEMKGCRAWGFGVQSWGLKG